MRTRSYFLFSIVISLLALLMACSTPGGSPAPVTEPSLPPGGESSFSVTGTWEGMIARNDGQLSEVVLEVEPASEESSFTGRIAILDEINGNAVYGISGFLKGNTFQFEGGGGGMFFSGTVEGDQLTGQVASECYDCSPWGTFSLGRTNFALVGLIDEIMGSPTIDTHTPLAPIFFEVAAIVDTTSEPVTRDQAQNLVTDANNIMFNLTPFGVYMVDFVEDGAGGAMDAIANRYISAHSTSLPDGIIIFSFGDDGQAKLYGGYAYTLPGPAGFRNPFNSPVVGNSHVYIGVVHYSHKFAACGYGDEDTVQSTVSINGECRNQPGTACVEHNGYSMCSNAVNDLYASTPTYFAASTIIHEILHSFSPGGNTDHYGTPECNARMGWPEGSFDPIEADFYNNMCPFVYDNFTSSYQP